MTAATAHEPPWMHWLETWDRQQAGYLPDREDRFTVMLDALAAAVGEDFLAVDLACGPGSLSQRLLRRFPRARSVAVDLDPVLLTLGQGALGELGGRLRWVEADLSSPGWVDAMGVRQVDAVLSTAALHWLSEPALVAVYRALADLIRPGGLFLNGDHFHFSSHQPILATVVDTVTRQRREQVADQEQVEDWEGWWTRMESEAPDLPWAERRRRFPDLKHGHGLPFTVHHAALQEAGFTEVDVLWQNLDNRVLAAVR